MKKVLDYWEILVTLATGVALFSALSTRVAAVEIRQTEDRENQKEIRRDVIDIKADVSYIRGRLEPK